MYVLHSPTTSIVHSPSSTPVLAKANGTGRMELRDHVEAVSPADTAVRSVEMGTDRARERGGGGGVAMHDHTFLIWRGSV